MKFFLIFLIIFNVPHESISTSEQCSPTGGICKPFKDCPITVNNRYLHGKDPTNFCDEDEDTVCCEEDLPEFSRISQKSKNFFFF